MQSFGPNRTYTEDDGIPRLHFTGSPTMSQIVAITAIRRATYTTLVAMPDGERRSKGLKPPEPTSICSNPQVQLNHLSLRETLAEFPTTMCNQDLLKTYFSRIPPEFVDREPAPKEPVPCLWRNYCFWKIDEEVVLIYWPPKQELSNETVGGRVLGRRAIPPISEKPREFVTSAITFRGQDLARGRPESSETVGPSREFLGFGRSILTGPFTFTSPTVYLAHRPISIDEYSELHYPTTSIQNNEIYITTLSQRWSDDTRSGGIFPLSSSHVYTYSILNNPIQSANATLYAQLVAKGKFMPAPPNENPVFEAVPLRFSDLLDPVPADSYYDARWDDCWGEQTHCGTITDDSFRPVLSIHNDVWKSMFSNMNCVVPDLIDPPIALQAISSGYGLKAPLLPHFSSYQSPVVTPAAQAQEWVHSGVTAAPGNAPGLPLATPTPLSGNGDQFGGSEHPKQLPGPLELSYNSPGADRGDGLVGEYHPGSRNSASHTGEEDPAFKNGSGEEVGHDENTKNAGSGGKDSQLHEVGGSLGRGPRTGKNQNGGAYESGNFDEGDNERSGVRPEVYRGASAGLKSSVWKEALPTLCIVILISKLWMVFME
jgi:hypothetical protein